MLKRMLIFLTVLFLLIPVMTVKADVIVEPENDFYSQHRSECVYLGRSFIINEQYDSASVKKEPGANSEIGVIKSGEVVYLEYSCLYNGDYWGLMSFSGWVKIDQLLVLYDYITFEEEHLNEFYQYNGEYEEIKKTGAAIAWPWPGSDTPIWTIESLDTENFNVSHAYKDDQGREWGFVTYLYGSRNIWVCLSDPLNQDIPAFNSAPEPGVWKSETMHTAIGQQTNEPGKELLMLIIIIILVVALVAGTVILIKVFWKPNKIKTGEKSND